MIMMKTLRKTIEDANKDDDDDGGYDNNAGQALPLFLVLAGCTLNCHRCQLDLQVPYTRRCQVEVHDMAQIKSGMLGLKLALSSKIL